MPTGNRETRLKPGSVMLKTPKKMPPGSFRGAVFHWDLRYTMNERGNVDRFSRSLLQR